ncbi:MAG TPA: hypothetical protein VHG88_13020 [Burkholderiales bacterium]|nr:hypothetical protein [Burkholderiales bacterium]
MSCTLQDAGEFVQARIGPAPSHTLLDCYRELLELCTTHRIERVLIVSEDGDATTRDVLVQALQALSSEGPAGHLRLALLAPSPGAYALYGAAERVARRSGIAARVFRERSQAVQWLTGRPAGEPRAPRH